jgi:hypothetical protein
MITSASSRNVRGTLHHLDRVGRLAAGADHLLMVLMPDQQDLVALAGVADRLGMHLGDERAGRVHRGQVAAAGLLADRRTHSVGAEDHDRAVGHLVDRLHEADAAGLEPIHHMPVVHDLVVDADRLLGEQVEKLIDHVHGHVDARAEAAGIDEEHLHAGRSRRGAAVDPRRPRCLACGRGRPSRSEGRGADHSPRRFAHGQR